MTTSPDGPTPEPEPGRPWVAFCTRHYVPLAAAILAVAAFNLMFRLGSEVLSEWDESLYATSAWEMVRSGQWVVTTFHGAVDYYNTKPPLNVWLIALSFKAFGRSLVSLRLASTISAWLTVVVLQQWTRRAYGPVVALFASLVLATTFGFVYVHAGRSAETDALFTLLVLLTVVTLSAAQRRPSLRAWLGLLTAAVFLLRGLAILMPLLIILAVEGWRMCREPRRRTWWPTGAALLLFAIPVGVWSAARWRIDQWRFFERMIDYDFLARSLTVIENHPGTPIYYLNILQKHQYGWILAGIIAVVLAPLPWRRVREWTLFWRGDHQRMLVGSWATVTLLIPTLMRTKLPWYLNTFYPVFALGIGWLLARAAAMPERAGPRRRQAIVAVTIFAVFGLAEGKLLYYSYHSRDLKQSAQGLLLAERHRLRSRRVFRDHWDNAELFVLRGMVGADGGLDAPVADFWRDSRPGDCLLSSAPVASASLELVRRAGSRTLYCRRD
jgi:4-amino-4-deoxy-L-arabinose transferase-like glycosyltransferase